MGLSWIRMSEWGDGAKMSIFDSWLLLNFMAKNGEKYKSMFRLEPLHNLVLTRKNSSKNLSNVVKY